MHTEDSLTDALEPLRKKAWLALAPVATMLVGFFLGTLSLRRFEHPHGAAGTALLVAVLLLAALVAGLVARRAGAGWESG